MNMDENPRIIKITYDNGVYCGQYVQKDNEKPQEHGFGLFIWNNGDRYEGEYVLGARTGIGTFEWANGSKYEGEFKNDIRSGTGKMTWPDGTVYEGDFVDGKRSGKGKTSWPNGETYIGWFENDHMSGHGILYSADGSVSFDGEWFESSPIYRSG